MKLAAPGIEEVGWVKCSCLRSRLRGLLPVVVCLVLGRRDIAQRLDQPMVVEPGHPGQGCQLHSLP